MGNRQERERTRGPIRSYEAENNNMKNNFNEAIRNLQRNCAYEKDSIRNQYNSKISSLQQSDNLHIQQMNDWMSKFNDSQNTVQGLNHEITNLNGEIDMLVKNSKNLKISSDVSSKMANAAINTNEGMANIKEGLTATINAMKETTNQNNLVMYDAISAQNYTLDKHFQETKNKYTTDNQKVSYQLDQNSFLNNLYFYLLITYYLMFLLFVYVFYNSKPGFSIYLQLLVYSLIIIYPWVISYIELCIYYIWNYVTAVINGNPAIPFTLFNKSVS